MTPEDARDAARVYLRSWLDVRQCLAPPGGLGLYDFDPSRDYLFEIVRGEDRPRVGGTAYLAVSRTTGAVRYAGTVGE